jgi:hypothetical protein
VKTRRISRRFLALGTSGVAALAIVGTGSFLLAPVAPSTRPMSLAGTNAVSVVSSAPQERPRPSDKDLAALEARLVSLRKTKTRDAAIERANVIYEIARVGNLDSRRFLVGLAAAPAPSMSQEDELERLAAVGALAAQGDKDAVRTIQARTKDRMVLAKIQVCSR